MGKILSFKRRQPLRVRRKRENDGVVSPERVPVKRTGLDGCYFNNSRLRIPCSTCYGCEFPGVSSLWVLLK